MKRRITGSMLVLATAAAACGSLLFCYYTARLIYLAAAGLIDAAHRTAGLRIGAGVFPVASFCFGWLGLICARAAFRQFGR